MANLKDVVQNIIHEDTQFPEDEDVVYLTVSRVGRPVEPGALDFGGSEYTEANTDWIEPVKRNDDDKYGWWELNQGMYKIEFNEALELSDGVLAQLQVWDKALKNGVVHPSQLIAQSRDPMSTFIYVSQAGVGIKENARISEVRLISA